MGCVNTSPVIKVKSIKSFKKEIKKNTKQNESEEDLANKVFSFSDFTVEDTETSNSLDGQSQISIDAQIENKELIFL